jgi:ubiquinone/menaquinone biosynthesis C-methylase UbiE
MARSDQHDDNVAGNTYDKYASTNPVEQRMMRGFFAALDGMLDTAAREGDPATIVEVGAGEGKITARLAERFPHATITGLDLPDDDLAAEWGDSTPPMLFGDATRLPFADASVDLVVGLEVLEHIPSPERALADIARVCRGMVIVSVPREPIWRIGNMARGRYFRSLGNTPGHINHWSARSFERFVATRLSIEHTARPLPWTMVAATP